MRVMILGGEGYLGSVLCNLLVGKHEVVSCDVGWFPTIRHPDVTYYRGNAFDIPNFEGYDAVVNLAGLSCDPQADFNPHDSFAYNTGMAFHTARLAKRDSVKRYIYASTGSVYGYQADFLKEDAPAMASTYYGRSKWAGEQSVLSLEENYFEVCAFRMGTLSGPSPRMRLDLIMNTMYKWAKLNGKVSVFNSGVWRPVIHVLDAAKLYQFAIERRRALRGVFNATDGNYTVDEIGKVVADEMGVALEINKGTDCRDYKANSSALGRTGFQFTKTLRDIIVDLKNHEYPYPLDDISYSNLETYKRVMSNEGTKGKIGIRAVPCEAC